MTQYSLTKVFPVIVTYFSEVNYVLHVGIIIGGVVTLLDQPHVPRELPVREIRRVHHTDYDISRRTVMLLHLQMAYWITKSSELLQDIRLSAWGRSNGPSRALAHDVRLSPHATYSADEQWTDRMTDTNTRTEHRCRGEHEY